MNMKMRTFTTACVALLMIGGLHTKAQANFVLGFEFNPDNMVEEPSLTIAPGVPFDVDILFEFTGGSAFPAAFGLDVIFNSTFVDVLDASFTGEDVRPDFFGQETVTISDIMNPQPGEFGIRMDVVGPFDADGNFQALEESSFSLGRLTLVGMNDTGADTTVSLLGFDNLTGLLADPGNVSFTSIGASTLIVTAIPEPASAWVCIMLGSVGIAARRRRSVA